MSNKHDRVVAAAMAAVPAWEHELELAGARSTLTLSRGPELMRITWEGGSLVHPLEYELQGVRKVRLRNVAEALRYLGGKPDFTVRSAARRTEVPRAAASTVLEYGALSDREVILALRGKTITWLNGLAEEYESATVPDRKLVTVPDGKGGKKEVWRTSRNIYMTTSSAGRRIITFPAVGEQFRSVALDTIVGVS